MDTKKLLMFGGAAALAYLVLRPSGKSSSKPASVAAVLSVKDSIKKHFKDDPAGVMWDEVNAKANNTSIEDAQKNLKFYLLLVFSDEKIHQNSPAEISSADGSTVYLYPDYIGFNEGKNLYLYYIPDSFMTSTVKLTVYLESQDTQMDDPKLETGLPVGAFTETNRYDCLSGNAVYTEITA